jgi:cytidine deaminase
LPASDPLVDAAVAARAQAHAPYSRFAVGAAVEAEDGRVFTGCNVENASYGLTICAERVAVFKAISEGARRFRRIAIAGGTEAPTPPCGACRQVLWECAGDIDVILVGTTGESDRHRLAALLPLPFDRHLL